MALQGVTSFFSDLNNAFSGKVGREAAPIAIVAVAANYLAPYISPHLSSITKSLTEICYTPPKPCTFNEPGLFSPGQLDCSLGEPVCINSEFISQSLGFLAATAFVVSVFVIKYFTSEPEVILKKDPEAIKKLLKASNEVADLVHTLSSKPSLVIDGCDSDDEDNKTSVPIPEVSTSSIEQPPKNDSELSLWEGIGSDAEDLTDEDIIILRTEAEIARAKKEFQDLGDLPIYNEGEINKEMNLDVPGESNE